MTSNSVSTPRGRLRIALGLATAVLLLAASGGPARAAEDESGLGDALRALKEAQGKKDEEQIVAAIDGVVQAHNAASNAKQRGKAQAALGALLKEKKLPTARSRAVRGLGELNDPKGSFKHLKGVLPSAKTPGTDTFAMTVLKAVGELKADEAVAPLLKLLGGTKDPSVAEWTAGALGAYADRKSKESIAAGLLDALTRYKRAYEKAEKGKLKPDAKGPKQALWVRAAPALGQALNALTGKTRETPDEWLSAYAEAKGKVAAFFGPGD